jgi:hypothetical protein
MLDRFRTAAHAFARRDEGAVAMMFGLSIFGLTMAMGCAIDLARAAHGKNKLASAVDNATLAAARMVKEGRYSDAEVSAAALAVFSDNMNQSSSVVVWKPADFKIDIDRNGSRIGIEVPAHTPTAFARIGGIEKIDLLQKATAVFALRDIEVGLALDVTGSMGERPRGGGARKIDTLKSAFEKFAALMLPDTPLPGQKVRLGIAPYSAAINLGSFADAASNGRSRDGCVTERSTSAWRTDASTVIGGHFNVRADGTTDRDPTGGAGGYECPRAVLSPLTSDRRRLIADVRSYREGGWTGGHFGVQWAWNLVSPEWGSVWGGSSVPDGYAKVAEKKLIKAVILMTDGSFNTAFHNGRSSDQAIALCSEMKAKGVQVFAIAFDAPSDAQATLRACASPGADYYADATNEAQLDAAFAQFAGKINALRLAQ